MVLVEAVEAACEEHAESSGALLTVRGTAVGEHALQRFVAQLLLDAMGQALRDPLLRPRCRGAEHCTGKTEPQQVLRRHGPTRESRDTPGNSLCHQDEARRPDRCDDTQQVDGPDRNRGARRPPGQQPLNHSGTTECASGMLCSVTRFRKTQ